MPGHMAVQAANRRGLDRGSVLFADPVGRSFQVSRYVRRMWLSGRLVPDGAFNGTPRHACAAGSICRSHLAKDRTDERRPPVFARAIVVSILGHVSHLASETLKNAIPLLALAYATASALDPSHQVRAPIRPVSDRVFVVHGRDDGLKEAVARLIDRLGYKPVILNERPDRGQTIIEKLSARLQMQPLL